MIKTVKDVDLKGKRIIMRVDFNVPMKEGVVQDDTRIMAALPTIQYILEQNPRSLVLMSHLGDPKKDVKKAQEKAEKAGKTWTSEDAEKFINGKNRMKPVVDYFAKKLGKDVTFLPLVRKRQSTRFQRERSQCSKTPASTRKKLLKMPLSAMLWQKNLLLTATFS